MLDLSALSKRASKQVGDVGLAVMTALDSGYVNSALVLAHAGVIAALPAQRNPANGDNSWLQQEQ